MAHLGMSLIPKVAPKGFEGMAMFEVEFESKLVGYDVRLVV